MSNLINFNNIHAALAESAYNKRPNSFEDKYSQDESTPIYYSQDYDKGKVHVDGGENLPNGGAVYLQPDETLHEEPVLPPVRIPNIITGDIEVPNYSAGSYQKGLLTDERAGFNAYFLTDTEELNEDTQQAYLVIRGSDKGANDWLLNNANFTLLDNYIPQAELANQAIKEEIKQIKEKAPNAKLDITGHSLGTMISAQAVAKLYQEDPKAYETIGQVVLFDGPDVTKSLKNMGLTDKEIEKAGEKVVYYVNPFDVVSMLNRTEPWEEQFGTVNVIIPINFNNTFYKPNSAHDFGEFQIDANGNPLVASEDYHPEMLRAGEELAKLIDKTIEAFSSIPAGNIAAALGAGVGALIALGIPEDVANTIISDYNNIIKKAEQESIKWSKEHISDLQNQIRSANGADKILLRTELLYSVVQDALAETQDMTKKVKNTINKAKEDVQEQVNSAHEEAYKIAEYLSDAEVGELLKDFNMSNFYDDGIEEETLNKNTNYQTSMENFAEALISSAQNIQTADEQGAAAFDGYYKEATDNDN